MATLIADILTAIRYRLVDPDKTNWSDLELTSYVTDAHRAIHFIVANLKPELVSVTQSGITASGASTVILSEGEILRDIRGWIGPDMTKLESVDPNVFLMRNENGVPKYFWISGFDSVDLYPVPDGGYSYLFKYVPQPQALRTYSPWPVSFDGFLVEFAVTRAGLRDEADMSQEASFMNSWQNKVEQALISIDRGEGVVRGYW
jgi:hypothetical protein